MSEELHATVTRTERLTFEQAAQDPSRRRGIAGSTFGPRPGVVGDLARVEREAVLCVEPRRKWSDLEKFDEEISEAEQASSALQPCG